MQCHKDLNALLIWLAVTMPHIFSIWPTAYLTHMLHCVSLTHTSYASDIPWSALKLQSLVMVSHISNKCVRFAQRKRRRNKTAFLDQHAVPLVKMLYKHGHPLSARASYSLRCAMNGGQEQLPKLITNGPGPTFFTMSDNLISSLESSLTREKSGNGLPENIFLLIIFC